MGEQILLEIIDDIQDNLNVLKKLLSDVKSNNPAFSVVDKFVHKIDSRLTGLNEIRRTCKDNLPKLKHRSEQYKYLYTRLTFNIQRYREEVYLLSTVYELFLYYKNQCENNVENRYAMEIVNKYIVELAKEINIPEDIAIFSTVQNEYASLPIEMEESICFVMLPAVDLHKPWKWVLLTHELGHLFYEIQKYVILPEVMPKIKETLRDSLPNEANKEEKVRRYKGLWSELWLKEIVADIIGVSLCGPAYPRVLITQLSDPAPTSSVSNHPPLEARIMSGIEYLKRVEAPSKTVETMEGIWRKFRENIQDSQVLPGFFSREILMSIAQQIADLLPTPFIVSNWEDVLRIAKELPQIEKKDVKLLIPAIALSDNRKVKVTDILQL